MIIESDKNFEEIQELYINLKKYAQLFVDYSKLGTVNECVQGNDLLKYVQYSGGEQYLISNKFGFNLQSGLTNDTGTFYKINVGDINNIIECNNFLKSLH